MSKQLPDSLIYVEDLVKRLPKRRQVILQNELKQKENNWYLLKSTYRLTRVQVWQSFRTIFWVGLSVFLFVFAIGQAAAFAAWAHGVQQYADLLPSPVLREIDLESFVVPTGTPLSVASSLPQFGILDATLIAVVAMVLVLAFKAFLMYTYWMQMRVLKTMVKGLEVEIDVIKSWLAKSEEKD